MPALLHSEDFKADVEVARNLLYFLPGLQGGRMILVVDHDATVLEKAREVLNRDRQVLLTSDPKRALDMVQQLAVKVVLVDVDIPDQGVGLIRELHQVVPDVCIIATSSAEQISLPKEAENLGVVEVLNKPITPEWKPVVERVRAMHLCL